MVAQSGEAAPNSVDFYFDPMCPWAYQGSIWMREVRDRLGIAVNWRFFSLEEINRVEGKKHPWERPWSYGWGQMRVGALLRRQGMDQVDAWYAAVGKAFHEDAVRTHDQDEHRRILGDLGHPPDLLDAALDDPTTSDEVKNDHDFVTGKYGAFGVPVLVLPDDRAVFGPVVVPAPTGAEAERLWELVLSYLTFPTLFELKSPKSADDLQTIASVFEPYLAARSWRTIENPAP
jgi:2-hydroxychromene-2-carboxylate isomerase